MLDREIDTLKKRIREMNDKLEAAEHNDDMRTASWACLMIEDLEYELWRLRDARDFRNAEWQREAAMTGGI